jgi:hypothetical protein
LNVLKTNYNIKNILFTEGNNDDPTVANDSHCDEDMVKQLNTLLRLNRGGRGGLQKDPGNAVKVVKVLEQVNDDLKCIYALLREHLFMFGPSIAQPCTTYNDSNKRRKMN